MIRLSRVLVGTDFSDHAAEALQHAGEIAQHFGAELFVAHVLEQDLVSMLPVLGKYMDTGSLDLGRYQQEFRRGALRALEALVAPWKAKGLRVEPVLLEGEGRSDEELVRAARERRAELLVLATHGHTGIASALLGSTAARVVRHAPCPVLTVKRGSTSFVQR